MHVWVVEYWDGVVEYWDEEKKVWRNIEKWGILPWAFSSREGARQRRKYEPYRFQGKTRIRKYVQVGIPSKAKKRRWTEP